LEIKSPYEIDSYKKINLIFIVIIMFIFFYCLLVPFLNFGFHSSCQGMPLAYCKSRGLTRAFAQILRLNFQRAILYNPYSLKIFSFFLIQLFFRFLINKLVLLSNYKRIVACDILLSIMFFVFSFYNLVIV
jgi:hypothetical protein